MKCRVSSDLRFQDEVQRVEIVNSGSHWQTIAKSVRSLDEERVKESKEDVDTLLVFVRFRFERPNTLILTMGPVWSLLSRPCRFLGR